MPSPGLAYWHHGNEGKPVVFLHGLMRNRDCFAPLFPALAGGARRRVYSVDQAGHGESPRLGSYRVMDHLPGLVEFLRSHVDGPAVLYGHSMGAMLAAALGAAHPELARAVIMEDPPFHTMGRRLAGTPLESYFRAIQPRVGTGIPWRELAAVRIGEQTLGQMREASQVRFMARCIAHVDPRVIEPVLGGAWLDGYEPEEICGALQCPALLLQSDPAAGGMLTDEDAAMAERRAGDLTLSRLPAGTGHQAHWQDTAAVTRHLLAFLESLE